MNLRSFNSVFIGISHSYVSTYFVKTDATGVELLETISKFGKRKKISSVLVYVIHNRAKTAKKCTIKRDARTNLFFSFAY